MFIGNQQTPAYCFTTNQSYKKSLLKTVLYRAFHLSFRWESFKSECHHLRRNKARGEIVDDLGATTEDSSESVFWIDDHLKRVLKKLVHSFIDAKNQLYGLQIRKKRLESFKSDGKVPSLHEKFSIITKEAEIKLLEATIEALNNEEQQAKDCAKKKRRISTLLSSLGENPSRLVLPC